MEADAEYRGTAHEGAIIRRERVDLRHRRRFGGIGQVGDAARFDGRAHQVAQELRIAARALRDHVEHVRWQRRLLRGELRHAQGIGGRERCELHAHERVAVGGHEAAGDRAPRNGEQPWMRAGPVRDVREQLRGRLVHVMRILDLDQRRLAQERGEERCHRFVQSRATVPFRQHLDFRRGRDVDPEGDRDELQPRCQLG